MLFNTSQGLPDTAGRRIRILCVDDHSIMRDGIAFALQTQEDMELVGEAASGEEGAALYRELRPDITLMDLSLPGMDGIETIAEIRRFAPGARIIVLTTYAGDVMARKALSARASGYLLKHMLRTDLIAMIRTVDGGGRGIPAQVASDLASRIGEEELSVREIDVLGVVAKGSTNKMVAVELGITEDTVKAHMKTILQKLEVSDRTHAVTVAMQRGFLKPAE